MPDSDLEPAGRQSTRPLPRRWLLVRANDRRYAVPAGEVLEIANPRPPTRLPGAPASVLGLINHRGAVVTVVDLGRLLGRASVVADGHRLVLVRRGALPIALATSDVLGFSAHLVDLETGTAAEIIDLDNLLRGVF